MRRSTARAGFARGGATSDRENSRAPGGRPVIAPAENGFVLLDGPHGAVAALTAEAAAARGENLRQAAFQAVRQRRAASEFVPLRAKDRRV